MSVQAQFESTDRFLRPTDVDRVRRNYRSIQVRQLVLLLRNAALLVAVLAALAMLYRRTQSDGRFAVRHLEISGAQHTTGADLEAVRRHYLGTNLFHLDIAGLRRDVSSLPWISRVEIEKRLPDTLRVRVVERIPIALVQTNEAIRYVDDRGVAFAALSPAAGDSDLPLISGAQPGDLPRCVSILRTLRTQDADLYARISEVHPLPPGGFAFFDRELHAFVYANEEELSSKWRDLRAIARAEHLGRGDIAYADLRFNGQVVIKPLRMMPAAPPLQRPFIPVPITN
ncbi:MAG: FtsQ-type POTRA domain-containing protein [Acidobacteriota bacterium]|nr:FtsQ-type POTRA domain-containing protein [Acidobacteriota bacterium]